MNILQNSWNSFSPGLASKYLKSYGHASQTSKEMVFQILKNQTNNSIISILDLGCGNGHLYEYFKERGLKCSYTGVDFSDVLLASARQLNHGDPNASFIKSDISVLDEVTVTCDYALYSHVIEMLSSPEESLLKAKSLAKKIMIRFFEPPEFENDSVEIHEMDSGDGTMVPYLRRKMSRDYYRLILTKLKCKSVDVYRDEHSKDQIHVLHY
jgi:SAM-dependent methyltransferase